MPAVAGRQSSHTQTCSCRIDQGKYRVDGHANIGCHGYGSIGAVPQVPGCAGFASHEAVVIDHGVSFILLRNGWYLENHTAALPAALKNGAIIGSAGEGRFASASRADYAGAAVIVLTQPGHENKLYELAADSAFTLGDLAAEVTKQTGVQVAYRNLPAAEYEAALLGFGLPRMIVEVAIDADLKAQHGALDSSSHDLSRLLGRPTTAVSEAVAAAVGDVGT
jgi:NAD(P)H dehydrogenase (quinone)